MSAYPANAAERTGQPGIIAAGSTRKALSPAQTVTLDWTRGIAAQLVLIGHFLSLNGVASPFTMQDLGVILFFVMSGFLIAASVASKPSDYDYGDFLIDRAARVFTPYVPALAFLWLAGVSFAKDGPTDLVTVLANLFMLQDFPLHERWEWFPTFDRVGPGRTLWSIAVEWWFYVGLGALMLRRRQSLWPFIPLFLPALVVWHHQTVSGRLALTWMLGALAASLWSRMPRNAPVWAALAASFTALAVLRWDAVEGQFYDFQLNVLIGASLFSFLLAVERLQPPAWLARSGRGLAAFSYSLYLTHLAFRYFPFWTGLAAANLLAIGLWWTVERHHRAVARGLRTLRKRLGRTNRQPPQLFQPTSSRPKWNRPAFQTSSFDNQICSREGVET